MHPRLEVCLKCSRLACEYDTDGTGSAYIFLGCQLATTIAPVCYASSDGENYVKHSCPNASVPEDCNFYLEQVLLKYNQKQDEELLFKYFNG